jgi:sugar lactone lactonase YvrE
VAHALHSKGVVVKVFAAAPLLMVVAVASLPLAAQPPPPPPCTPAENVVCGQQAPEDLVALGPSWVAAGAYSGTGGVMLIRVNDRASHTAYPSPSAVNRPDTRTYPDCPGPPGANGARFTTHGVYVAPGNGPVHKLFVVGHGDRESIEVFEVDTAPATPAVTWLGCVVAPEPIGLNSVRGLPDGGFITTNFLPRGGAPDAMQRMMGGETNGELWEWHPTSGWQKLPGSEAAGANGVELSDDGRTLYVAAWGSQSFFRLSRGANPPTRDEIPLGFRVDNIHWARDGTLYAVGQAGRSWKAVKIDPQTLAVREVVTRPDTPEFGAGTALVEVGDTLWVGSYRGNRIAIVPAP